jgi:GT2 family glycosyltransferase
MTEASWQQRYEEARAQLEESLASQAELTAVNEQLRFTLWRYEASWMVARAVQLSRLVNSVLPVGSKRRRLAVTLTRLALGRPSPAARAKSTYQGWLAARTPTSEVLERQRRASASWERRPLVSLCMPVHDPDPDLLRQAVASVEAQSYENWELCICDDASTGDGVRQVLESFSGHPRIRVVFSSDNVGISRATNKALAEAGGEYVGFVDHDDVLAPHALYHYGEVLQADPSVDVLYCDEDLVTPSGQRFSPFFKPGWSPEALLATNYVTHFVVARRRLVEQVGGLRPERDGAQDHDLLLRLAEVTDAFHHVAEVLYSWRQSPTSTATTAEAKQWAYAAGLRSVEDALVRRQVAGRVEAGRLPGTYRVRRRLASPPPGVTIVIPTRDRADLLGSCLDSIRSLTEYPRYSVVVLDNDSRQPSTRALLDGAGVRVVGAPGPFNYAAIVNRGFAAADTEYVITLNNDTVVQSHDWIEGLLELGVAPQVGVVGCQLVFPDGRPQHQGIAIACGPPAVNLQFPAPGIRLVGDAPTVREVSAVTGACSLVRRSAWESVGGFDERFAVAYNDVDFCLRIWQAGYKVLYTPHVTLVHKEGSSRGSLHPPEDESLLVRRWAAQLARGDPYFTPHVVMGRNGLELRPRADVRSQDGADRPPAHRPPRRAAHR